eukprot:5548363-Amphidinium_carterae.1
MPHTVQPDALSEDGSIESSSSAGSQEDHVLASISWVLTNYKTGRIHVVKEDGQAYCGRSFPGIPVEIGFHRSSMYPNL